MFVVTSARLRSRSVRSETWQRNFCKGRQEAITLLQSFCAKQGRQAINISPRWGEPNSVLLHFQVEFTTDYHRETMKSLTANPLGAQPEATYERVQTSNPLLLRP